MIHPALPLTLVALAMPAASAMGPGPQPGRGALPPMTVSQVTIHERIILRVPRLRAVTPAARATLPVPVVWKEKKGPKCIAVADLGGAMFGQRGAVDFVLTGGRRIRAKIDGSCKPLDFYSGFYLRPAADGMVCADRDSIRMRSGASCGIDTFRKLVPAN